MIDPKTKEVLDETLSDEEKANIQSFCDNVGMVEAVKKVLLWSVYNSGTFFKGKKVNPQQNAAFNILAVGDADNEKVGAELRAMFYGAMNLSSGFEALNLYKVEHKGSSNEENPAR